MPAASKATDTKIQLNFKGGRNGNDLLNFYAVSAGELKSEIEDFVKLLPQVAAKFGFQDPVAVAADPAEVVAAPAEEAERLEAEVPASEPSAPSTQLSAREAARARLKGAS